MCKLVVILLGILGCLFFSGDDGGVSAGKTGYAVVDHALDGAPDDAWHCLRHCNADPELPRLLREVTPATLLFQRGGHAECARGAERFFAERHAAGVSKAISEFESYNLSVGLHAVDYYVYRLRRLLI